jgi:hypothetical protein
VACLPANPQPSAHFSCSRDRERETTTSLSYPGRSPVTPARTHTQKSLLKRFIKPRTGHTAIKLQRFGRGRAVRGLPRLDARHARFAQPDIVAPVLSRRLRRSLACIICICTPCSVPYCIVAVGPLAQSALDDLDMASRDRPASVVVRIAIPSTEVRSYAPLHTEH